MADGIAVDGTNVSFGVPSHTVDCMLIPACLNSGFVIRQKSASGLYTTAYNITNSSQTIIENFLKTGISRTDNVLVNATGTLDSTGALVLSSIVDAAPVVITIGYIYDNLCKLTSVIALSSSRE